MKSLPLALKIGVGYALLVLALAAAVLLTITQVRELQQSMVRLEAQHMPTTENGLQLRGGISRAKAALRGWLLTQDQVSRSNFREAWSEDIKAPLKTLENLSSMWDLEVNKGRINQLFPLLEELEKLQFQIEELALTDRERAIELMNRDAVPLSREIEDILGLMAGDQRQQTNQKISETVQQTAFLNNLEWLLLAAGVLIGAVLSFLTARSITRPVAHAVSVADNIGGGDLETRVNVGGSRELDALGAALVTMRDSLQEKTRANERFNWLSSGQNRLSETMRGDKSPEELATGIVTLMANYTGANVGSLYLVDERDDGLSLAGGYAFGGGNVKDHFRRGEGLIGQAAAERKALLIDNIGDDYIRVSSSLLDAPPHCIYVCPFLFEGNVLGVLELGKLTPFDSQQQEFIDTSMEAVGIALNSALARRKIQQLLEETQQQSEELQQQQEELEQTNEELEEQAQHLREQQEELQVANEELEEQTQLIAEKNQSLESARESIELKARQLEISSKYKSEFLANMSHELRTPLNSLLILANDLAANARGNLDEEQVESAQVISKSGHDLLRLINDILDLSKVEAGKLDVNVASIDIADFANTIRRNFRRQAGDKGLRLDVVVDANLPGAMRSDRQRLEQIVNNLVSNAVKFTSQGGVTINLSAAPGGYLVIAVRDTGIGIPADKLDAIFEAFIQADGGTSRKYGGTGLGLSISRELARLLGGQLTVTSEPGRGSTFTLRIPQALELPKAVADVIAVPPVTTEANDSSPEPRFFDYPSIPDQRHQITEGDHVLLIVEDDESFARILADQCVKKGFKHINAATGEDGLRLAVQHQPHAIILDLELPGMDGHRVLRELKSDPQLRHIPVHIISAMEKTLDPIRTGAVDYLTKPVSKTQLDDAFARMEGFISRKMKNLLIVEDSDVMRKAIVKLIGNGDVQCFEAVTGREALRFCEENAVDCMVLDVGLPDMSGFEVIRELETALGERAPPIIIYTGRELSREENDELQQHAETIIVKGVKSEERLLDETALFLHRTVKNLPPPKKEIITRLYDSGELLRGRRVLVVDDDMRNVFALSKVLKNQGMEVIKAENGLTALARLDETADIDFVLMDIMMPEMDGYECMRKIRQRKELQDLPIVALTAKAMKDDRQKCIDAGANDYISKPVDVERLISLMRIWVRK